MRHTDRQGERMTSVVVPCEKCHRAVVLRFVMVPTMTADGKATMSVTWKADPHICPRPKNSPPPTAPTDPLRAMDDEALALVRSQMAA